MYPKFEEMHTLTGTDEVATTLEKEYRLPPGSQLRGHWDLSVLIPSWE